MNPERSAQLAGVKLRGLVNEHRNARGAESNAPEAEPFGAGAALELDGAAWVHVPDAPPGTVGTAVTWAMSRGANELHVLVDGPARDEAFRASGFGEPQPRIWSIEGRSITPAESVAPSIEPPPSCPAEMAVLHQAGLEVVADHGVWIGEINGLEVARVGHRDGACAIDIGVGAYDQFASSALAGDRDPAEALAEVIGMVRPHRESGSPPHPMGRLVRSRWLRAQLIRTPDRIGLDSLDPIPLLQSRPGLMEAQPAAALGSRGDATVLVVCTVGLDLAVAETAAGLIALHDPTEVRIVLPNRDRHPRIVAAAEGLSRPTEVLGIDGEWSD